MAIALVQQRHSYPGSSLAFSSANTAGNLLVCWAEWNDTTSNPTISDKQSNTWTAVGVLRSTAGTAVSIQIWYAANCKAGSNTVTTTFASDIGITIAEWSGVATSSPLGITSTKTGTSTTTPTTNSFTPTAVNNLL